MATSGQSISAAKIISDFNTAVRDVIMKNTYGLHNPPKDPSMTSIICVPTEKMGNPASIFNPDLKAGTKINGRTIWKALVDVTKQLTRVGTFTYVRRMQFSRNTAQQEYAYVYVDGSGRLITKEDGKAETDITELPEGATVVPGPLTFRYDSINGYRYDMTCTDNSNRPFTKISDLPNDYYFKAYAKYYTMYSGSYISSYGNKAIVDNRGRLIQNEEDLPDNCVSMKYFNRYFYIYNRHYQQVIVDNNGRPITEASEIPSEITTYTGISGNLYIFKDGRVLVNSNGEAVTRQYDVTAAGGILPSEQRGSIYINKNMEPATDSNGSPITEAPSAYGSMSGYSGVFVNAFAYIYLDRYVNPVVDSNGYLVSDPGSVFDDSSPWNNRAYVTLDGKVCTSSNGTISTNTYDLIQRYKTIVEVNGPGTVSIPADTVRYKLIASSSFSGKVLYSDEYKVPLNIPGITFGSTCHFAPTTGTSNRDNTSTPPNISGVIYANHVNYIIAACLNGWQNANKHHEDIIRDMCHDNCHSNCYGDEPCWVQSGCYNDGDSSCYIEDGCYRAHD